MDKFWSSIVNDPIGFLWNDLLDWCVRLKYPIYFDHPYTYWYYLSSRWAKDMADKMNEPGMKQAILRYKEALEKLHTT